MTVSYLARHFDAALDTEGIESCEELAQRQITRLKRTISVIITTGVIPRRLGADATDMELALDKKRARRVAFALHQALRSWPNSSGDLPMDDSIRAEGAQLDWSSWRDAFCADLLVQLRLVSTYSITSGQEPWGRSAVVKLENELSWTTYALRD